MKNLLFTLLLLFNISNIQAQNVNIPDSIFKAILVKDKKININQDTNIQISEANSYNGNIWVSLTGISDLTGIEAFPLIKELLCIGNKLKSLDVSKNTALTMLMCNDNLLTSLDVSKNTAIISLFCRNNKITSLDVSKNTALTTLDCSLNKITSLDVSKNTALTTLNCSLNKITSLDVTKNTALTGLGCGDNLLTSLDITKNTALTGLGYGNNFIPTLDISKNIALKILGCNGNKITSLDVSKNILITQISCDNNLLTSLDITKNTALTYFECSNNLLTNLNVKNGNNTKITFFWSRGNQNLNCIEVDDVIWSNNNWKYAVDSTSNFSVKCPSLSNLETQNSNSVSVYPNPTTGNLYLTANSDIVLTDLLGKVVFEIKNTNYIDISEQPKGIYFLIIMDNNFKEIIKVLKE